MNTIITFLPYEEVESFKKFAEKIKKNVEGFDYTIGKPYEKLFIHPSITEEGRRGKVNAENGQRCEFYSIVNSVYHGKVYLGRATKNPKKGIDVVAI